MVHLVGLSGQTPWSPRGEGWPNCMKKCQGEKSQKVLKRVSENRKLTQGVPHPASGEGPLSNLLDHSPCSNDEQRQWATHLLRCGLLFRRRLREAVKGSCTGAAGILDSVGGGHVAVGKSG